MKNRVTIIDEGDKVTFITEKDIEYILINREKKHLYRPWKYTLSVEEGRKEWYKFRNDGFERILDLMEEAAKDIAEANKSIGRYQQIKLPMIKKPFPKF